MEFKFEDPTFNKLLLKAGISDNENKLKFAKVFILFVICWLPLAIMTLINGTFWTGEITTSFITSFDTQVRFLISMPIFILAQKLVSLRLGIVLKQFIKSGIIANEEKPRFDTIIEKQTSFLQSKWTNGIIILICYVQVFEVFLYASSNTSFLSWQLAAGAGEPALNLAGKWTTLISRPLVLFLSYKWLLRILVWGNILRKISNLNIKLYPQHPDLAGGLGFLGYALRYFSPITFAISAIIAGNMADLILIEGLHIADLKLPALGYFIFISLLISVPMLFFTAKMIGAKEASVFENNDFANGMYRELQLKITKGYDQVTKQDLDSGVYSAVSDYNAVADNVLKMKFLPFTLRDMIPIWVSIALPFLAVVLLEIPVAEIIKDFVQIVM